MRYYADAANAVCVKNIKLCIKFMLEFTYLTWKETIWEKSGTYSIPFGENGFKKKKMIEIYPKWPKMNQM